MSRYSDNRYILIAIDYATIWVEPRVLRTNTVVIVKFLYDHIFP
jgi:hypothetical protein